jgi:hypothetical protein
VSQVFSFGVVLLELLTVRDVPQTDEGDVICLSEFIQASSSII